MGDGGLPGGKPGARPEAAFSAFVRGRVQGVGFRWSAREEAKRLGLTGWVRNAEDGSVEIMAEGRVDRLDAFAAWLKKGPPASRVDEVVRRERVPTGTYRSFTVEP